MKLLMIYGRDDYTTANYLANALYRSEKHKVITAGPNAPNTMQQQIQTGQSVVLSDIVNKCPEKPEAVLVVESGIPVTVHGIESCPIPTIYYGIDTHMHEDSSFAEANRYKYVFWAQKPAADKFKQLFDKENVHWLPLAADLNIHKNMGLEREYDISYVGGLDSGIQLRRRNLLKTIQGNFKTLIAAKLEGKPTGGAYGIWMTKVYNKSKLVFNCSVNGDLNMRVFEAMACGAVLVTDKLPESSGIDTLFKEGEDYLIYEDSTIVETLKKYLKDEELLKKVAESGFQKVAKNHTYDKRVEEMLCQVGK